MIDINPTIDLTQEENPNTEEDCKDLKVFGEEKMELILDVVLDKLDDDWFTGTTNDEDDLDETVDYLELKSHDDFIDANDEAYKERMCKLLGMTYKNKSEVNEGNQRGRKCPKGDGNTAKRWKLAMNFVGMFSGNHVHLVNELCGYVLWKPSRDFTRPLGPPSGLKGLLHTLNATVIPTKVIRVSKMITTWTTSGSLEDILSSKRPKYKCLYSSKDKLEEKKGLKLKMLRSSINSDTDKIMTRMDAITMKMDAQYKEFQSRSKQPNPDHNDDDTPMSHEEEAKFMQTFRRTQFYNDYRDRDSNHDNWRSSERNDYNRDNYRFNSDDKPDL
ncbi:hypothetical protein Tco_1176028 [Tanacetum coccineum]